MSNIKPHKEYSELVLLLKNRGMIIKNEEYAKRKLSQVGYYRLSGFWFSSRKTLSDGNNTKFVDEFLPNTSFDDIYKLYLFDKKLRLLMLDVIERLEVSIRSIIAHELGKENPLAYMDDSFIRNSTPKVKSNYCDVWLPKLQEKIKGNKSEFIKWHRSQHKDIPFWVVVEIWEFGTLSKYYSFLKGKYQNRISSKFRVNSNVFGKWLHEINLLRNDCAHHSRIWNKDFNDTLLPVYNVSLSNNIQSRLLSRILVLGYLIKQTGSQNYNWLEKIHNLIETSFPTNIPNVSLKSMGLERIELLKEIALLMK